MVTQLRFSRGGNGEKVLGCGKEGRRRRVKKAAKSASQDRQRRRQSRQAKAAAAAEQRLTPTSQAAAPPKPPLNAGGGNIFTGIGGWTFEPWRGVFYPDGLPHTRSSNTRPPT